MGAAPIGKGDWVECIDARPDSRGDPVPLVVGVAYQVASVGIGEDASGVPGPCITLVGVEDEAEVDLANRRVTLSAYDVDRFRPLYRPDASLIGRLITDIPADAPASPEEVMA